MDETAPSPGRGTQNRHRRRTPKTNNNNVPSPPTQSDPASSQPPRTRGRNNGQNNQNNHNQTRPRNQNPNHEKRSTTPEAAVTTAPPSNNITTPRHKGSPAMRQVQVTEIKFAGVFTNSPAASDLPIPSFCVKPTVVPQSPTPGGNNDALDSLDSQDDSEDGTQSSSDADTHESEPSPASPVMSTPAHVSVNLFGTFQDESPLDRIFRADREEKQRALGQGDSTSPLRKAQVPEPLAFSSPVQLHREARVRNALSQTSPSMSTPSMYGGISPRELDGTPSRAIGPAFSTPYQQRIFQALQASSVASTPPRPTAQVPPAEPSSTDRSEALKRYLFGNAKKPSQAAEDSPKPPAVMQTPTKSPFESIYTGAQSPRSPDLVLMEDNLRRILNLGPALDANKMHEQPTIYS
jgi:hypothetical protein